MLEPEGPLPAKAEADALHWAVAAAYACDYVLTWNYRHLNNALIKRRAERIICRMAMNRLPSALRKNSTDIQDDEIVEDIHAHRAELAARFSYDIDQLFEYYQRQEEKNPAHRATEPVSPTKTDSRR